MDLIIIRASFSCIICYVSSMKFELAERRVCRNVECPFFPKNAVKQWPGREALRVDISSYYDLSYSLRLLNILGLQEKAFVKYPPHKPKLD